MTEISEGEKRLNLIISVQSLVTAFQNFSFQKKFAGKFS